MSMGGGGGSSGSSGTNQSQDTTNWQNVWTQGTNAAQAGLDNAESGGPYYTAQQLSLADQAYTDATDATGLNQSNSGYSSLLDPTSTLNSNLYSMATGANTNPQLDAMYNQAAGQVQGSLAGQFNSAGRLGSGAQEFDTSQGLNNLATDIYGGAYDADQNRALSADSALAGNISTGSSGLSGNYSSLLSGLNSAAAQQSTVSPYTQDAEYNSLVSPYLSLNNTTQNNSSLDYDDTGSFSKDLGYVGSVLSLVGSFA